jgi:hypothetical protein
MLAVCFFPMSLDVFIASNFMTRLGWEWSRRVLWSTSEANQQWLPPSLSATSGDRVLFLADLNHLIFRYWQPRERPLARLTPFLEAFLTRQWSGYELPQMDHGYGYQVCVGYRYGSLYGSQLLSQICNPRCPTRRVCTCQQKLKRFKGLLYIGISLKGKASGV